MKMTLLIGMIVMITACDQRNSPVQTGREGMEMPSFELLLTDSITRLSTASIPAGEPVVFFYFNPGCPHCKSQMQAIADDKLLQQSARIYVFTSLPLRYLKKFRDLFQLNKFPSIVTGIDRQRVLPKYLNTKGVPLIAVYGKDRRLKAAFVGKTGTRQLRELVAL